MIDHTETRSGLFARLILVLGCLVLVASVLGAGAATVYGARHKVELTRIVERRIGVQRADAAASPSTQSPNLEYLMADAGNEPPDAFASTVVASEPTTSTDAVAPTDAAAGTEGPEGPEGPAGADGAPGADGAEGPRGPRGPKGSEGATGPAGVGLADVDDDGGGYALTSPDGKSFRVVVTNSGIWFHGPSSNQLWRGAQSQPLP